VRAAERANNGLDFQLFATDASPEILARASRGVFSVAEEFRNTKVLQDLSARLVTEENIQTIYEEILTAALEITRADAGTVQMLHD